MTYFNYINIQSLDLNPSPVTPFPATPPADSDSSVWQPAKPA